MIKKSTYRFGHRQICRHYILGKHYQEYPCPHLRRLSPAMRNDPCQVRSSRNNDQTRTFLVVFCKTKKNNEKFI